MVRVSAPPAVFPAGATDGDILAFIESESGQNGCDFTGDGCVGPEDYSFLALSFTDCGDGVCCGRGAPGPTKVRDTISVRELKERGLGYLSVVDVDGDGWIDVEDCLAYMQQAEQRRSVSPNP